MTASLRLLGPVQVEREGAPLPGLQSGKALALLGYLIAQRQALSRGHLTDLFWQDLPEKRGRANLSWTLHKLSSALPGCLKADRHTVRFQCPDGCWVDVDAFEALAARGDAASLAEAAALYRNTFLHGLSLDGCAEYELWLVGERERWRGRAERVLSALIAYHSRQGECAEALRYARRLLALAPWREETHRQVMRLLAKRGQRGAALAQYEACRRALEAELGVAPAAETVALYEQIVAGEMAPLPQLDVSFVSTLPHRNLPAPLTSFVGRQTLLVEVRERLRDPGCRLLTLAGPGGCGKTRLALEAAAGLVGEYADGVHWVSLAPLRSAEGIVPAIAQAVGLTFYGGGDPRQQLLSYLRHKELLLLLDNYEHLLARPEPHPPRAALGPSTDPAKAREGNGAGVAIDILNAAPRVKILVTSRARLNVPSEHLYAIGGMDVPPFSPSTGGRAAWADGEHARDYSAVQLFLQSARRIQPELQLEDDDLSSVVQICSLVDGMPLGILLAAAWMQMLTPTEIARELMAGSRVRLDFLETEWREVPERQRSMRAVFDHSWRLLGEREQEVLQGLSVFRGGCTRHAAQEVTGASLRELRAVVNWSLLEPTPTGRYEIHELLRQYAEEQLDRSPSGSAAARDRHAAYYLAALERWATDLCGARQLAAVGEIEADIGNVRAAWNWAVEQGQVAWPARALEGLCLFYEWRGHYQEGEAACRVAVDCLGASVEHLPPGPAFRGGLPALAHALAWQGSFAFTLGQNEVADRCFERSLAILDDGRLGEQHAQRESAFTLLRLSTHVAFAGDIERAKRLAARSLALYRACGDRWGMVKVLIRQGVVAWRFGHYDEAKDAFEEGLALSRALGDRRGIAWSLTGLGACAGLLGQLEEEERLAREGLALAQQVGDGDLVVGAGFLVGVALHDQGRFEQGQAVLRQRLAGCRDHDDRRSEITTLVALAKGARHLGSYGNARAWARAALDLAQQLGQRSDVGCACAELARLALVEGAYEEAEALLTRSVASFQQAGRPHVMMRALATLPYVARGLGQPVQARQHLGAALRFAFETARPSMVSRLLPAAALLLIDEGRAERAVELYALASRSPDLARSRWYEDVAGTQVAAAGAALAPEVLACAQARGRARDLWDTARELSTKLEGDSAPLAC
jgi:DNA-binding SARP family transcriptional activator/predicted ATPase